MPRGLEGRRIAVAAGKGVESASVEPIERALSNAGAQLHRLDDRCAAEEFHGAKYAALVLVGGSGTAFEAAPELLQLTRECLASDKPVAAIGSAVSQLLEAGGAAGRTVAADGELRAVLEGAGATVAAEAVHQDDALLTARSEAGAEMVAQRLVGALSDRLEEREVDLMSELSFPASDPPAVSPATIGPAAPDAKA